MVTTTKFKLRGLKKEFLTATTNDGKLMLCVYFFCTEYNIRHANNLTSILFHASKYKHTEVHGSIELCP